MAAPQPLQCPSCSSPLREESFDAAEGRVKCAYCGALMLMPAGANRPAAFRERPPLPLPGRIELRTTPHGIVLTHRWFQWAALFLIPFCLFWNGFLVFWYTAAFKSGAPTVFTLLPLIHVAVGVGLTYWTVACLINKTRITVERGEVVITHGPLPWFGYRRVPGVMIDQVYAKAHVTHGKHGPRTDYQLWYVNANGRHEKLHASHLTAEQALYLEQQLEKALGIQDRAMAGELPR